MAAASGLPTYELQWEDKLAFDPKSIRKAAKAAAQAAKASESAKKAE